jgi:PII-like signaling protein
MSPDAVPVPGAPAGAEVWLFRLTINGSARWHGRPLYRAVVEAARASGMAGASVFPVEQGYGRGGTLRDALSDYSAADTPVVVEVVDTPARVGALIESLGEALAGGHVTVEPARVVGPSPAAAGP